jgi:type VI protein secretion system component Hcp
MSAFIFFKHEKADKIVGEATQGIFGKLPSPNGNSSDNYYHGWIQLNSVTQTVTRAIESGRSGTARARAGCVLEDIEIEKEVDTTTTVLLEACSGGTAFPEVWVHMCTAIQQDDVQHSLHPYLEFRLFSVKVTSHSINASGADDGAIPTETLSLNFDKVHWKYFPIGPYPKNPTAGANDVGNPVVAGWDVVTAARFSLPPGS